MEACLKILIKALILILCQKMGYFWSSSETYFSRMHKIKARPNI